MGNPADEEGAFPTSHELMTFSVNVLQDGQAAGVKTIGLMYVERV